MDTKIKLLILSLFSAFSLFGQSPLSLAVRYNISSATGGDPYTVTGVVSDDLSRFTGSDVQVGDSLYVIDGSDLYVLKITAINSVVGPTVNLTADDPSNAGISLPTGQAAIVRPTPNYKLPIYIAGLRDDLRSMMMNRQAKIIDQITGGGSSSITDFVSAGENVPPSAAASANGGETWRNMTTGELWGSNGTNWYPYTRGPKECQDTVLVSSITVQSGGSVTTGSPLVRNTSGVWQHMYNHPSGTNLVPDGVVTDIIVGGRAIVQYCGVRKGSGATPNTSYYVDQTISTGFTTTKPATNIRPLGKVASNGDFLINAGLLFSRDNTNANNGVSTDGTNIQLGNNVGSSSAQLISNRYLPMNNKSLTLQSNNGKSYIQFSADSASAGGFIHFKFRDTTGQDAGVFMKVSPIRDGNQNTPIYFSMNSQPQSGNNPNNVFTFGFNTQAAGGKFESGLPILGESWESNYRPGQPAIYPRWIEKHEIYMPSYSNTQRRLSSYTISESSNSANVIDFYHTVDRFKLRDTSGQDYLSVSGAMVGQRRSVLGFAAGPSTSMQLTIDSTNNNLVFSNTSTSGRKPTSAFQIEGYRQYAINSYSGRAVYSLIDQGTYNQHFWGGLSDKNVFNFWTDGVELGYGMGITSNTNTATSLQTRGHIFLTSGLYSTAFGQRSDINMSYIGTNGSFAIRTKALQVGPNAGASLPLGVALQVNSNLANTSALFRLQTTTDSVKYFVTSVNPNSVITGRVGDIANGSNGTTYIKKTGNNTDTGWEALVSTSGTSTSISTMMREESFTATAAQTAFTIAYSAPAVSGTSVPIRVYRNGVRLFYVASGPTITQFTYSGTTVTTAANTAGDIITIEYLN